MGLFRRAASPAVTLASGSVHSSGSVRSASSSAADTPRSSTSHTSPSPPYDAAPASFGQDLPSVKTPSKSKSSNEKDKRSIAAGLLAAGSASAAVAPAAASPWAGYLDPASISTPATPKAKKKAKRFGTLSAKKSTKKIKPSRGGAQTDGEQQETVDSDDLYEDDGQLETFFPMSKVTLEPLALPGIAAPSPALPADRSAFNRLGYKNAPNPLLRLQKEHRSQKESLGIARFSVGGMLDMVDQKMQKEEATIMQQQKPSPTDHHTALHLRDNVSEACDCGSYRLMVAQSSPSRTISPNPCIHSSSQSVSSALQSERDRASSFPTAGRSLKSSQDGEEVLSPSASTSTAAANHSRRRISSASSAASEAITLRDEVRELLAIAKRAAALPYVRDSIFEPIQEGRQRTRSASEDLPRPIEGWQIVNSIVPSAASKEAARPASPAPSKAGTIYRPHYGAFRGHFPHKRTAPQASEAVPPLPSAPPVACLQVIKLGHGRKRSMSVPSAFQVPGYKPSFGIALPNIDLMGEKRDRAGLFSPAKYDESSFSLPKKALQPVREIETQSFIELDSSNGSRSSTALPSPSTIESMLAAARKDDDPRHERARTAAGHPSGRASPLSPVSRSTTNVHSEAVQDWNSESSREARSRANSDTSVLDPYSPPERRQRALDRSTGVSAAIPPLGQPDASAKPGLPRSPKDRSLAARVAESDARMDRYWASRLGEADLPVPKAVERPKATRSSIGPPPRSPLPSLPVPQEANMARAVSPALLSPAQMPLPASRAVSPIPFYQANSPERSRGPSPDVARRAVSPGAGYSRDNRPRPKNVPHVPVSRTTSRLPPPARPPPASPLDFSIPLNDTRAIAVQPAEMDPSPLAQLRQQSAPPFVPAVQDRKLRPEAQMTFDSIASYYADEPDSPPPPVPQSPYISKSPQLAAAFLSHALPCTPALGEGGRAFRSPVNVVRNVSSSSTLASSRPSMSMDGSHDTHMSIESAITEEEGNDCGGQVEVVRPSLDSFSPRGKFTWTRPSPRKDSLPGRGLASALREKAIAEQQEELLRQQKRDDDGYLGSPEQKEGLNLAGIGLSQMRRESNASTSGREMICESCYTKRKL